MDQDKSQTKEEKAASVLKEVYQKIKDKPIDQLNTIDALPSSEEAAEQIKGSDADVDRNVGNDEQHKSEESAEEVKGSDADIDKTTTRFANN